MSTNFKGLQHQALEKNAVTLTTFDEIELYDWLQRVKNVTHPSIFFMFMDLNHPWLKEFDDWLAHRYDGPRLPDRVFGGKHWAQSDHFNHPKDSVEFTAYDWCHHSFHGLFGDGSEHSPDIRVCYYCGLHHVDLTHKLSDADDMRENTTYDLTADGQHSGCEYFYGHWHTRSPLRNFDAEAYTL